MSATHLFLIGVAFTLLSAIGAVLFDCLECPRLSNVCLLIFSIIVLGSASVVIIFAFIDAWIHG